MNGRHPRMTALCVWLDGDTSWNRVYLGEDGKLYIHEKRREPKYRLDNHQIDKLDYFESFIETNSIVYRVQED